MSNWKSKAFYIFITIGGFWVICFFAMHLTKWLPFSVCGFKALTGLPCPFCGGTRCLAAIGQGHFMEAMLIHPLIFASTWLLIAVGIYKVFTRKKISLTPRFYRFFVALILVNWVYLLCSNF